MGGTGETWRFRTAKPVPFRHPRWPPRWEAWGRHGDAELLNYFVTISTMAATAAILKILNVSLCRGLLAMVCPSSICPSATFHIFDISNRIISMMTAMAAILKVFSSHLLLNGKSGGVETWWKALGQHGDLEMLKWFRSDIQYSHHGSHLESLHLLSAPKW